MNDFNLSDLTELKREPRIAKLVRGTPLWITPDGVSYARIVLALPLAVSIFVEGYGIALVLLLLAALSDWFDGALAHARGEESVWGAFLDPLADKAIVLAAMLALAPILTAYFTLQFGIIALVEVVLVAIRLPHLGLAVPAPNAASKVKANTIGKCKLVAEMCALACIISFIALHPPGMRVDGVFDDIVGYAGVILLPVATLLTVSSLISRILQKN